MSNGGRGREAAYESGPGAAGRSAAGGDRPGAADADQHPSARRHQSSGSPPRPATAAAPAPPRTATGTQTQEPDGGWPRDYATPAGAALRVFQPQVGSWDGQKHMVAFAAVSYTAKGAPKPALGTVKLEAGTSVAVDDRLVNFDNVKLTETHFADLPADQVREVTSTIEREVPRGA